MTKEGGHKPQYGFVNVLEKTREEHRFLWFKWHKTQERERPLYIRLVGADSGLWVKPVSNGSCLLAFVNKEAGQWKFLSVLNPYESLILVPSLVLDALLDELHRAKEESKGITSQDTASRGVALFAGSGGSGMGDK